MQAAVPTYVGASFDSAAPGHHFRLYLPLFNHAWGVEKDRKKEAVQRVVDVSRFKAAYKGLATRNAALTTAADLVLAATSTAPFVTGMGIEHPLENGFAFLDPYGLPYLPGSSVKGVLRRAAEELALFEAGSHGWTIPAVWWLFGFDESSAFFKRGGDEHAAITEERRRWREAYDQQAAATPPELIERLLATCLDADGRKVVERAGGDLLGQLAKSQPLRRSVHLRGSLELWDVIPQPPAQGDGNLRVDIMNPHYSHYYQLKDGKHEPPHDAGSPNPIFFLTVPAGWTFTFVARLRPVAKLPGWFKDDVGGKQRWRALVEAAFEYAFDWLGFGGKTSLGYGRMTARGATADNLGAIALRAPVPPPSGTTPPPPPAGPRSLEEEVKSTPLGDQAALKNLASRVAGVADEAGRARLARILLARSPMPPGARALLWNHPVIGKYRT